jgi:hypothetical protein
MLPNIKHINMADCVTLLANNFARKCGVKPKAGILKKFYLNYEDIDFEASQLAHNNTVIETLVLKDGAKIYQAEGNDRSHRVNHALSVGDFGNGYIHTDEFTPLYNGPEVREELQKIVEGNRVVTIVEKIDKGESGELAYEVVGFESGMVASADDYNSAENSGTRNFVVATKEGEEEATGIKLFYNSVTPTTAADFISTNLFVPA